MGKSPLPLWTYGIADPARKRRPLEGNWRDLFAIVERGLVLHHISPTAAEHAELWEVAAWLGANDEPSGEEATETDWERVGLAEGFDPTFLD